MQSRPQPTAAEDRHATAAELVSCVAAGCSAAVAREALRARGWTRDQHGGARCPGHGQRVTVRDDAERICSVADLIDLALGGTQRKIDPKTGYLDVPGRIGRAGNVQPYRARELGLDGDPDRIVRLYRPADEVFAKDCLDSFNGVPLTDNHPPDGVHAKNYRERNVGVVGPVRQDSEYMLSEPLSIRDAETVRKVVDDGKVQLSNGYDFTLDMTAGVSPKGEAYDGVQRNIRGNHVAIVDLARGGYGCRIADNQNQETTMKIRIKALDAGGSDLRFDVDEKVADSVQDALDRHHAALMKAKDEYNNVQGQLNDAQNKLKASELARGKEEDESKKAAGDAATKIAKLEAENASLKAMDIDAAVEERTTVVAAAKAILGDSFETKGKKTAEIRIAILEKATSEDGPAKGVAAAYLRGTKLADAKPEDIARVFDAVVSLGVATVTAATDAAAELEQSRKLAGTGTVRTADGGTIETITGRAAPRKHTGAAA